MFLFVINIFIYLKYLGSILNIEHSANDAHSFDNSGLLIS